MARTPMFCSLCCFCFTVCFAITSLIPTGDTLACEDYQDYTHWIDAQKTPENRRIAAQGDSLYVVHTDAGLKIFDLADPALPAAVDSLDLPGVHATRVLPSDSLLYVVDREYGIRVIRISGPGSPVMINSVPVGGQPLDGSIAENHLYVAAGGSGLCVLNLDTPELPVQVGHIALGGISRRVLAEDSIAYVGDQAGMLKLVDISDPSDPDSIASVSTAGVLGLEKADVYVYAVCTDSLRVVDVSDPSSPQIVHAVKGLGTCEGTTTSGDLLFTIPSDMKKTAVYNISNPGEPVLCGKVYVGQPGGRGVACANGYCYALSKQWLAILEIAGSTVLTPLAWDQADLENLVLFGSHYIFGTSESEDCYYIYDVSDPLSPAILGGARPLSPDVRPQAVTTTTIDVTGDGPMNVGLIAGYGGLYVFDLSDPESPSEIDWLDIEGAMSVEADSNYAYVGYWYNDDEGIIEVGFEVVCLSKPDSVYSVNHQPWICPWAFDICGAYLYAAEDAGVTVFDVSDPHSPQEVGHLDMPGLSTHSVQAEGDYGFAVSGSSGCSYLCVIDTSNPESPQMRGQLLLPCQERGDADMVPGGGCVYVCNQQGGFFCCDISDPDNPYVAGTMCFDSWRADLGNDYAFVATHNLDPGLVVAPLDCGLAGIVDDGDKEDADKASREEWIRAFPNPSMGTTRLDFSVSRGGHTQLSIYDVTGKRVSVLVDEILDAGRHTASLGASELAPGIYFARIRTMKGEATKKILLMR